MLCWLPAGGDGWVLLLTTPMSDYISYQQHYIILDSHTMLIVVRFEKTIQ